MVKKKIVCILFYAWTDFFSCMLIGLFAGSDRHTTRLTRSSLSKNRLLHEQSHSHTHTLTPTNHTHVPKPQLHSRTPQLCFFSHNGVRSLWNSTTPPDSVSQIHTSLRSVWSQGLTWTRRRPSFHWQYTVAMYKEAPSYTGVGAYCRRER